MGLMAVWGEWEIRVLLLSSLSLQILLLFAAGLRKRNVSSCLSLLLWLAYLLADYIAIYALGYLSQNQKLCAVRHDMHLLVFWAPFLILHLGGQDTITAFAIEDNELWKRHLLSLISQVVLALYVFWKTPPRLGLLVSAVFMFIAGIVKYAERTWALKTASMDSLRSSMVTPPDAGPNYAKFMEEYHSSMEAGLKAEIIVVPERPVEVNLNIPEEDMSHEMLVVNAHKFFATFRRLFVDLILSFQDRTDSLDFFRRRKRDHAYKVVEIELSLMYEVLHSKSQVIHTWPGRVIRLITLPSIVLSFAIFLVSDKQGYNTIDKAISYILSIAALLLEMYAIGLIVVSYWTYNELEEGNSTRLSKIVFQAIELFRPMDKPRWSNQMAQYNLITYCLNDQPWFFTTVLDCIKLKRSWDNFWYPYHAKVTEDLKELLFRQLKTKANSTTDPTSYRRFGEHRGQWALQRKGFYNELGWGIEVEFDESILLWHIATDLCFYVDGSKEPTDVSNQQRLDQLKKNSREMSNYMLFLLVVRPFMLTAGIGQIRFGDTCAEAKNFFRRGEKIPDETVGTKHLLAVKTDYKPREVKGDRSKSVLFDASRLAKELMELTTEETRWALIASVWVEMLCYAASKCRGNFHAKQLSMGGELLTVVWLLMAHFGIGEQYRVEAGHARAKLIIEN